MVIQEKKVRSGEVHTIRITLLGCDDHTTAEVGLVSDHELTFLERVIGAVNAASEYGCQPTMIISQIDDVKIDTYYARMGEGDEDGL